MTVNGNLVSLEKPLSVSEYLEQKNYNPKRVAIELNQEILPKSKYQTTILTEADTLEIVTFVGGGWFVL